MADYKLSGSAKVDLIKIYEQGVTDFGLVQADKYLFELEQRFLLLAKNVDLGRTANELLIGLRRFPYGSHTVFYSHTDTGILVVRVLGQRMDFSRHLR